jgi:hypothetical protein
MFLTLKGKSLAAVRAKSAPTNRTLTQGLRAGRKPDLRQDPAMDSAGINRKKGMTANTARARWKKGSAADSAAMRTGILRKKHRPAGKAAQAARTMNFLCSPA